MSKPSLSTPCPGAAPGPFRSISSAWSPQIPRWGEGKHFPRLAVPWECGRIPGSAGMNHQANICSGSPRRVIATPSFPRGAGKPGSDGEGGGKGWEETPASSVRFPPGSAASRCSQLCSEPQKLLKIRVNLTKIRINLPKIRISLTQIKINLSKTKPAQNEGKTAQNQDKLAQNQDKPAQIRTYLPKMKINLLKINTNLTQIKINLPKIKPAQNQDKPPQNEDKPIQNQDEPAQKINLPKMKINLPKIKVNPPNSQSRAFPAHPAAATPTFLMLLAGKAQGSFN